MSKRCTRTNTQFVKGPFYNPWTLGSPHPSHFAERDPKIHAAARRTVASAYSINTLVSLESYALKNTNLAMKLFDKLAAEGKEVDLAQPTAYYAYDTVAEITWSSTLGLLEAGKDTKNIAGQTEAATEFVSLFACSTSFGWLLTTRAAGALLALLGRLSGEETGPALFQRLSSEALAKRKKAEESGDSEFKDTRDLLYRFMDAKNSNTGKKLQDYEITSEMFTPIVAGADTTRSALNAFIRYVYTDPAVLKKLRAEIQTALDAGQISIPPTFAEASKLDYFQACMKEAMRVHPGVGFPMQRVVPKGGRQLGSRFYKEGTLIGQQPRLVHFDPRAYGPDAAKFKPERWLTEDRTELEKYNLTFNQGTRVCLGKHISNLEMSIYLPTVVHEFNFEFANPKDPRTFFSWHSFLTGHDIL